MEDKKENYFYAGLGIGVAIGFLIIAIVVELARIIKAAL